MKLFQLSLRIRIFFSMILLVLVASILIAGVTIFQYKADNEVYHKERLERKEEAIKENINFVLKSTTYPVNTRNIPLIFKERNKIYELARVHNLALNIYDLNGKLLIKSKSSLLKDSTDQPIDQKIIEKLNVQAKKRYLVKFEQNDEKFLSSYSYITDNKFKPLAILNLPYLEDDNFNTRELWNYLKRLTEIYVFMLLIAIAMAFLLSRYITKSLKTISDKIDQTRLNKKNTRIKINDASKEIYTLVNAYNSMVDELEESAVKLASNERETAWREMAKQVAHEIKNPLTPMRLTVQNFQRKFDPTDANIHQKLQEYSDTLIQQIDTMSSIASAFSNFAKMPAQQNETLDVVKVVGLALDIFNEDYIVFEPKEITIIAKMDRTQLIRVVTNLVKNGIQAIPEDRIPSLRVGVQTELQNVVITITDNGIGVSEENKYKVFEPKFTTKSSGMGLGLAMVKNIVETYGGSITFTSTKNIETTFTVKIPRETPTHNIN